MTSTTTCSYGNPVVVFSDGVIAVWQSPKILPAGSTYEGPAVGGASVGVSMHPATSTCITVDDSSGGGGGTSVEIDLTGVLVFYGVVLFLIGMFGVVWLFAKKR